MLRSLRPCKEQNRAQHNAQHSACTGGGVPWYSWQADEGAGLLLRMALRFGARG